MTQVPGWACLALLATLPSLAQTHAQPVLLSLTVVDAAGWKVSGAFLSVDDTSISARTDTDGKAQLWLVPGSYAISANAAGFLSKTTRVDLKKATDEGIELAVGGMCSPCLTIENPIAGLETTVFPLAELLPYIPLAPAKAHSRPQPIKSK